MYKKESRVLKYNIIVLFKTDQTFNQTCISGIMHEVSSLYVWVNFQNLLIKKESIILYILFQKSILKDDLYLDDQF